MKKTKAEHFENHRPPVSRRDFLSRGSLAFSATLLAPTFLSQISRASALEPTCAAPMGNDKFIPMLIIDCAGGAAFPGNFLVGSKGGPQDLLPSYDTIGWNPRDAGALDMRFGLPMAAKVSQILKGITSVATPEAQAKFRMGSLLHFSQDDSQSNLTSAIILALELGSSGSIVQRGLGMNSSLSGGNTGGVNQSPNFQPISVASVNDVLNAVSMGPALDAMSVASRRTLIQSVLSMSREQLMMLSGGAPGAFADQMFCAYQNASNFSDAGKTLDPRNDALMSKLYAINNQTANDNINLVSASIVMNVLKKQSGPGVITIGGCDYHDGSQTSGDQKDLEIGLQVGRAIQAAHLLKTPLFIQLITDGGIYAKNGTRNWDGDSGDKGMTVVGYYNPLAAPKLLKPGSPQIGGYNVGQGADQSTIIGADPGKVAYASFANYLQVCGTLSANTDMFATVFGPGNLDQVLLFEA